MLGYNLVVPRYFRRERRRRSRQAALCVQRGPPRRCVVGAALHCNTERDRSGLFIHWRHFACLTFDLPLWLSDRRVSGEEWAIDPGKMKYCRGTKWKEFGDAFCVWTTNLGLVFSVEERRTQHVDGVLLFVLQRDLDPSENDQWERKSLQRRTYVDLWLSDWRGVPVKFCADTPRAPAASMKQPKPIYRHICLGTIDPRFHREP